jgi:hypothetical protein
MALLNEDMKRLLKGFRVRSDFHKIISLFSNAKESKSSLFVLPLAFFSIRVWVGKNQDLEGLPPNPHWRTRRFPQTPADVDICKQCDEE